MLDEPVALTSPNVVVSKSHPHARTILYYIDTALAKLRDTGEYDMIITRHLDRFWDAQAGGEAGGAASPAAAIPPPRDPRDVERRTGGMLRIATAGSRRQYEDDEVISAVSSGAVELLTTSLNQCAYDVPMAEFNYDALLRASARPGSEIRALVDGEIGYCTNTHVMSWLPRGGAVIFSRRVADLDPAAIADRQVGAPDELTKELTKACGGSPHLMSPSDLYGALEKHSLFVVIVNDKVWDSLPPDQRRVLAEASEASRNAPEMRSRSRRLRGEEGHGDLRTDRAGHRRVAAVQRTAAGILRRTDRRTRSQAVHRLRQTPDRSVLHHPSG